MNKFIKEHFQDHILLIGDGFHWVSGKKLVGSDDEKEVGNLFYMDPSRPSRPRRLSLLSTRRNIYFFKLDEKLRKKMKNLLEKILEIKFSTMPF